MKVTATAERDGRWWVITIPDVEGGIHTQARRLDQVPAMAADAVSSVLGIDPESVEVTVRTALSDDVEALLARTEQARRDAAAAQEAASEAIRDAVRVLRRDVHLTTRDAADLLDISYQRVAQLERA